MVAGLSARSAAGPALGAEPGRAVASGREACASRPPVTEVTESGNPIPPQRRRRVPSANQDRLVEPDRLGTLRPAQDPHRHDAGCSCSWHAGLSGALGAGSGRAAGHGAWIAGGRRRGLAGRGFAGPPLPPGMPERRRDHRGHQHADGRERIPRGQVGQGDPLAAEQIPASGEQGGPGGGAERVEQDEWEQRQAAQPAAA